MGSSPTTQGPLGPGHLGFPAGRAQGPGNPQFWAQPLCNHTLQPPLYCNPCGSSREKLTS